MDLQKITSSMCKHVEYIQENLSEKEKLYLLDEGFDMNVEKETIDVFENIMNYDLLIVSQDILKVELIKLGTLLLSCEPAITPTLTSSSQAFEDFFAFLPKLGGMHNDAVVLATLDFYQQFLSYSGL